jgi:hypothetical protein
LTHKRLQLLVCCAAAISGSSPSSSRDSSRKCSRWRLLPCRQHLADSCRLLWCAAAVLQGCRGDAGLLAC